MKTWEQDMLDNVHKLTDFMSQKSRSKGMLGSNSAQAAMRYIKMLECQVEYQNSLRYTKPARKPIMRIDGFTYEDIEVPSDAHRNWEISVWGSGGAGSLPVTMLLYPRTEVKRDHSGGKT